MFGSTTEQSAEVSKESTSMGGVGDGPKNQRPYHKRSNGPVPKRAPEKPKEVSMVNGTSA